MSYLRRTRTRLAAGVCAALLFAAPALATPAQLVEDFLGSWEVEQNFQGNSFVSTITFMMNDDGEFTGTWEGRQGSTDLQDVAFADGKVTFKRSFGGGRRGGGGGGGGRRGGGVDCEVMVDDGKLMGKIITPRGEREFTGARKES